jgi:hypothetical protein
VRIYYLTSVGESLASSPSYNPTLARKILYFMRRHGNRGSMEQFENHITSDKGKLLIALRSLQSGQAPAIKEVGG